MFDSPPSTPSQPGPVAEVKRLWEVIGAGELTQDEEDTLSGMLREMTSANAPAMTVVVGNQIGAAVILHIVDVVKKNVIVATLFEAPQRLVTAIFKDWLVGSVQDGVIVSDNPDDWVPPPTDEEFEAFLESLKEDEGAAEFAALVAGFDTAVE